MKAIMIGNRNARIDYVFSEEIMQQLREIVDIYPERITPDNLEQHKASLQDAEMAFSTWGMCRLDEDTIRTYLPNLKIIFYAAGSVKGFAEPFLKSGVKITSAQSANAVPVAEYAAAQIILANKGFFQSAVKYKENFQAAKQYAHTFPGNFNTKVGIIGAGRIGRGVIERLSNCKLDIYVFDPFLPQETAEALGVTKTSLEYIFEHCQTISNHLANNPQTAGMLNGTLFDRMLPNATFINTGRGAQVVEADLIKALKDEPARTAVLDVTYPEPVEEDSELLSMPNVFITPHISGSFNQEVIRMAEYIIDELKRYINGEPLAYEIQLQDLETLG